MDPISLRGTISNAGAEESLRSIPGGELKIDFGDDVCEGDAFFNEQVSGFYGHGGLSTDIIVLIFWQNFLFGEEGGNAAGIDLWLVFSGAATMIVLAELRVEFGIKIKLV